jgi:DNA-binding response OmpR family regulator
MMPGMDGLTLCAQLKTDERTSHIPIIMLTARTSVETKLEGLENGADDYLTKPFITEELIARVKNLLTQRKKLRERFSQAFALPPPVPIIPAPTETPAPPRIKSADEKFLQKLTGIIEANLSDPELNVEFIEQEIGMSRVQLYRKIHALTDQTPGEFIRNFRLKKAAELLSQKQGNVSQIAYQVGFTNLSYFTRTFREVYRVTPSQYADQPKEVQS